MATRTVAPVRVLAAPHQNHKRLLRSSNRPVIQVISDESKVDFSNYTFKELTSISEITYDEYCGPTPESNWVIPGVLLVGAYPASQCDEETYELLTSILKQGVTKFICLQQEVTVFICIIFGILI